MEESANVPWFISVRLVVLSVILQLLLKVYSHNRVTDCNNFGIMSVVSEVFNHWYVYFVGLSEGLMLPKNQQSTSYQTPIHVLFPVTVPTLDTRAAVALGYCPAVLIPSMALLMVCGAGLSECLGWSTWTAQTGAHAGIGDPWHEEIGSDCKVVT